MSTTSVATATRHTVIDSPIGELTLVRGERGLAGVYFPGHWTRPDRTTFGPRVEPGSDVVLTGAAHQLDGYLAGSRRAFELALEPTGTELATRLRRLLIAVPYGTTTTYGALAAQLGGVDAREVGALVGQNPLSIVVPCHRVVGSTGKLTGYAGGITRKRHLLELEGALHEGTLPLW